MSQDVTEKTEPPQMSVMVPAYFYPAGRGWSYWVKLFETSDLVPVTAIVNPANGPGKEPDTNYIRLFEQAKKSNATMIGYVYSSYTKRPPKDLIKDIDNWIRFYPSIQGIFIDEQASGSENVDHYLELYQYIREKKNLRLVVTNPGTVCAEDYFSNPTADVVCLYEKAKGIDEFFCPAWTSEYLSTKVLILQYGVKTVQKMLEWVHLAAKNGFGYIYVTPGSGGNPWKSLPEYWNKEVSAIRNINSSRR